MMNIVACASDNYAMQCGVLFLSICQSNKNAHIHFFVLTDSLFQDSNRDHLEEIIHRNNTNNIIDFVSVNDNLITDFKSITSKFYPKQVLYRLLVAELLPEDINKVLYLDCDIIVRHSLKELWETDISSFSVACVPDALSGLVGIFNRLEYPQKYGYFNSGVLLINLDFWREKKIYNQFLQFAKNSHIRITLPDQDILNSVLHKSKKLLPLTYNSQSGFLYKVECMLFDFYGNKDEIEQACCDPVILHLAGERPWYKGCEHPYKAEYYKYKDQTPWKNVPLKTISYSKKETAKRFLRSLLCKLGVLNQLPDKYNRNHSLVS